MRAVQSGETTVHIPETRDEFLLWGYASLLASWADQSVDGGWPYLIYAREAFEAASQAIT